MKTYIKKYFMSWREAGETATALVEPDGDWFSEAINCLRDGSMGEKDASGVYERIWFGDGIYGCGNADEGTKRLATINEAKLWLEHCSIEEELGERFVAVVFSSEGSYALFESIQDEQPSGDLERAADEYANSFAQFDMQRIYSKYDFKAGAKWQKEQMMKGAVEGVVYRAYDKTGCFILSNKFADDGTFKKYEDIKLIIVKED